eukprot:2715157-Pyramimonas_sp.AAC.1
MKRGMAQTIYGLEGVRDHLIYMNICHDTNKSSRMAGPHGNGNDDQSPDSPPTFATPDRFSLDVFGGGMLDEDGSLDKGGLTLESTKEELSNSTDSIYQLEHVNEDKVAFSKP